MLIALALVLAQDVEIVSPQFVVQQGKPQLRFKLKLGEGTLLGIDLLKAGVSSWSDDKGTTLGLKDAKAFYGEASVMTQGSGADLVATVQGKHTPAEGATSMDFTGEMPVRIGLDLKEGETKDVVLKPGAAFDVGPYAFKIKKLEKAKDSFNFKIQDILRAEFSFDAPQQHTSFDLFKELKFFGADGKEWPSKQKNFQGSFQGGGEHRLTVAFLPTDQALTLKWAVYGKIETVVVPLKHAGPIVK